MSLSAKRQRFVDEYLVDHNATQAAIRAGYSPKTASEQSAHLLGNASVKAAIETGIKQKREQSKITADRLLQELAVVGFSNISDYLYFDGRGVVLKNSTEIPRELLACVSEVSQVDTANGTQIRFKLHNKIAAIETICKMLGLFNSEDGKKDRTEAARAIAEMLRLAGPNR